MGGFCSGIFQNRFNLFIKAQAESFKPKRGQKLFCMPPFIRLVKKEDFFSTRFSYIPMVQIFLSSTALYFILNCYSYTSICAFACVILGLQRMVPVVRKIVRHDSTTRWCTFMFAANVRTWCAACAKSEAMVPTPASARREMPTTTTCGALRVIPMTNFVGM